MAVGRACRARSGDAWGAGGGAMGGEERIWSAGDGVSAVEVGIVSVGVVLKALVYVSSLGSLG